MLLNPQRPARLRKSDGQKGAEHDRAAEPGGNPLSLPVAGGAPLARLPVAVPTTAFILLERPFVRGRQRIRRHAL